MVEDVVGIRPTIEEKQYLGKNNLSPSDFWHDSMKEKMRNDSKEAKKEKLKDRTRHVIFAGLGIFLIFYSFPIQSFLAFLISFLLGIFFLVTGLVDIMMELADKLKVKRSGRNKTDL